MNSAVMKISSLLLLIGSCISSSSATPKPLLICQYSGYCRVNSDCYPGNKCVVTNPQYSQCLPDSTQYSTIVGCLNNNLVGVQCSDTTTCCDPGATCNYNAFRQCSQPASSSLLCRDPLNFGNSTGFPMISPTASPSTIKPTNPTNPPSIAPTSSNTIKPVGTPSNVPTTTQTLQPSSNPSVKTSSSPILASKNPSVQPASAPSGSPLSPSNAPTTSIVNSISPVTKAKNILQPANTASSALICQYGGYCRTNSDCVSGNKCDVKSPYFSQCVPDSTQYLTSNCLTNNGEKCTDSSICCDPGAVCNHNVFRQCTQPTFPNCSIPSSYNAAVAAPTSTPLSSANSETPVSKVPVITPSTLPSSTPVATTIAPVAIVSSSTPTNPNIVGSNLICAYGGYCRSNADCVLGNKCDIKSAYFSQCVPDTTQYLTTTCLSNYGAKCTDSRMCCDPGAICSTNVFPQCVQPSFPDCTLLSGFRDVATATGTPATTPSISPTNSPVNIVSSNSPVVVAGSGLICQYGGYCRSNADCVLGNKCDLKNPYFSQCVPDSTQYLTVNCVSNYGAKCSDSTTCCDPGAICNHSPFRQCTQPSFPNCTIPSGYSTIVSTTVPSAVPSILPTITVASKSPVTVASPLICQYSGYCRSDSDCIPGNKCNIQNSYYSQCIPDTSKYLTANCLANYGQQCSNTTTCCDPGATCNHNKFRQCAQPVYPTCSTPTSFSGSGSTTVAPTISPVSSSNQKICQYCGYCKSTADCALGNKCTFLNPYYSQCLPDLAQYSNDTRCIANYGSQCSSSTKCCDPGAFCNAQPYRQCQPLVSPSCSCPTGFSTSTAYPSATPIANSPSSKPQSLSPSVTPSSVAPTVFASALSFQLSVTVANVSCAAFNGNINAQQAYVTTIATVLNLQPSDVVFIACSGLNALKVKIVSKKAAAQQGVIIHVNITVPLGSSTTSEASALYNSLISHFNAAALSGNFTLVLRSVAISQGATSITFALVSQSGVATPFVLIYYNPTIQPTIEPSSIPTEEPSSAPTESPTGPSTSPTEEPSAEPSSEPTESPTGPSTSPTEEPSVNPAFVIPTEEPSNAPTESPTGPNASPTEEPSLNPAFVIPTEAPSSAPTESPTGPNTSPTEEPSLNPAFAIPTEAPSSAPTESPTGPNTSPTEIPSLNPAIAIPTEAPSSAPTESPTGPNTSPTEIPSLNPAIAIPTEEPTTNSPVTDAPTTSSPVTDMPNTGTISTEPLICLYGDCSDSSNCVPGAVCVTQRSGYKTCLEDPTYTAHSDTCHTTTDYGCGGVRGASGCCNPDAVCNSAHLCTLSDKCVMKSSNKLRVGTPVQSPTLIPSYSTVGKSVICLFGDCTKSDTVCVYGAYCKQQNPYFKQCVEDPAFTNISSFCHVSNYDYGCGGASGAFDCCNPGASCNANHICTLSRNCVFQPSVVASSPSYSPTSAASAAPIVRVTTNTPQSIAPTSVTVASGQICLYGECTHAPNACVSGSICQPQNPFYSQCIEDPTYTSGQSNCHYLNSDWGCGGGVGASACCNPSASCQNHICSLSNDCVYYLAAPVPIVPSLTATSSPVAAQTLTLSPVLTASATPVRLPSSSPVSSNPISLQPISSTAAGTYSICLYGDCSSSLSACRAGAVCIKKDSYYSQCLEDPQYKATSNTCILLGNYGCSASKGCCNPATSCFNGVCIANVTGCWGSAPNSGKAQTVTLPPSSVPTVKASSAPISSAAICLYGDCTKNTAGCVAGSVCISKTAFYSQCLENPAFNNATNTCYRTGVDFGCGSNVGTKGCCNPSATCVNHFCTLSSSCK